jgi:CheY-like chemotaxis protein
MPETMSERPKVLILDDEPDFVDVYRDVLSRAPSRPEVFTATTGARALALLESETFSLLITDLAMPAMDGFQVLALVRRRFPAMRTVVLTAISDDQYRARAYAMGIDLYLEKPAADQDVKVLTDCIESLLERSETAGGFRGVQSKSLVDLIQLESLSLSSAVLRITNGPFDGRIWIQEGNVIDAATQEWRGEEAFRKILAWKSGNFELLPAEPSRPRTIHTSVQGLLLDSAQAMDEAEALNEAPPEASSDQSAPSSLLAPFTRCPGVEFVLKVPTLPKEKIEAWGVENAAELGEWVRQMVGEIRRAGEILNAGPMDHAFALGPEHHLIFLPGAENELCAGVRRSFSKEQVRETSKQLSVQWAS